MRAVGQFLAAAAIIGCVQFAIPARAAPQDVKPTAAVAIAAAPRSDGVVRQVVSVEGKQVPLPDGDWILAGSGLTAPSGQLPPTPSIASVALLRLRQDRVDAAILIQTNRQLARIKWSPATFCDRTDLYFAQVRYASDHDGSCAYAAYVRTETDTGARIDPAWAMARRTAGAKGWQLPTAWVDVVFRITDPLDVVQVRYLFDPWGGNGPAPRRLSNARIQSLIGWTGASWDVVEAGFRNRIDDAPAFRMRDWPHSGDGGLEPTGAQPVLGQGPETIGQMGHLGAKMVTYRTFGTLTDLSVNYLWLGSLPSAGGLAIVSAVASSALYFVHELVWSHFEKPAATPANLAGVGEEGPQPAVN